MSAYDDTARKCAVVAGVSAGPSMVVEREPDRAEDAIHCVWSDGAHIHRDKFPRRTLDKVKTEPWPATNKTSGPRQKGLSFACLLLRKNRRDFEPWRKPTENGKSAKSVCGVPSHAPRPRGEKRTA